MEDDEKIVNRIAIEQALSKLDEPTRELIQLIYKYEMPQDYGPEWPKNYAEIGRLWGIKWEGVPISEATVRYKRDAIAEQWRGAGKKQKNRSKSRTNQ